MAAVNPDYVTDSRHLQAAIAYAARGFRVYPCQPGSKVPAGKWGDGATSDVLEVFDLWLHRPDANILIACGPGSGLTVLDFDVKRDAPGEALALELLGAGWRDRYCHSVTPSRGFHVWVPYEPAWGNVNHVPGLDVQGDGAYIIAPPSRLVAGLCGEKDTPGPYVVAQPHLPLVSTLDAEAHARITAKVGERAARAVPVGSTDMPAGWETCACPTWADVWPMLSGRIQWFVAHGDPGARPPDDPTAKAWDSRSEALMAVATNLLGLKAPGSTTRVLNPAQVLQLLASTEHALPTAAEHAGSWDRAPWWLWRYCVVPARDNAQREAFGPLWPESEGGGESGNTPPLTGEQGAAGGLHESTGAVTDSQSSPEITVPDDPVQQALAYIAQLAPPYDTGIREICYRVAQLDFDTLAQQRVIEALHQHTDVGSGIIRKQLAGEIRAAVAERRDAKKRDPGTVVSQYVYVEDAGAVWRLNPPGWVSLASFRAMWGQETSTDALEPGSGMQRVARSTYAPREQWAAGFDRGEARWIWDKDSQRWELNTWEPSSLIPTLHATDEDVRPWLRHLDDVLRCPAADRGHVLDWLACTVQRPGEKINHMLLLGGGQGLGKDTLLQPVMRAVGKVNTLEVTGADAISGFDNQKLSHCALLVLQELSTGDLAEARRAYNQLKTYAASPPDELQINIKGIKQFPVPNLMNVAAVTNDRRALRIEQDDRRAAMVWCEGRREDIPPGYFDQLWGWYTSGGLEVVAGWLLQRDLSRFNPKAPPPATSWRVQAQEDSLPDVAQVVRDLIALGEGAAGEEVTTAAALLPLVRAKMAGAKNPPTERSVGYALTELGYRSRRVKEPRERARAAGRTTRRQATFYLLRNEKRWQVGSLLAFWTDQS